MRRNLQEKFERKKGEECSYEFSDFYKSMQVTKKLQNYFEQNDLPYECLGTSYEIATKTLKINVFMSFKAYGDGFTEEIDYKAERSTVSENVFVFEDRLNRDEAGVIFPLGLVKKGLYYPTSTFHYSDYGIKDIPEKLYWVDSIELHLVKDYD